MATITLHNPARASSVPRTNPRRKHRRPGRRRKGNPKVTTIESMERRVLDNPRRSASTGALLAVVGSAIGAFFITRAAIRKYGPTSGKAYLAGAGVTLGAAGLAYAGKKRTLAKALALGGGAAILAKTITDAVPGSAVLFGDTAAADPVVALLPPSQGPFGNGGDPFDDFAPWSRAGGSSASGVVSTMQMPIQPRYPLPQPPRTVAPPVVASRVAVLPNTNQAVTTLARANQPTAQLRPSTAVLGTTQQTRPALSLGENDAWSGSNPWQMSDFSRGRRIS